MKMRKAAAPAQTVSAAHAADLVRSGMWLDYYASINQPDLFDTALGERVTELSDLTIRNALTMRARAVFENDPDGKHAYMFSLHMGAYDRKLHDSGRCSYIPLNLGEGPDYYRRFIEPVDILILKARPADADGNFNVGPTNIWFRAIIERARLVIIETNTSLPHVIGEETDIHISEVDYIIEGDNAPIPELPNAAPLNSTARLPNTSWERSGTAPACRSASAACPTPCAACSPIQASKILASTPK